MADAVRVVASEAAPEPNHDSAKTDAGTPVTIDVLASDVDPDGDSLTVTGTTQPTNGSVAHTDDDVTYTPAAGFSGTETFEYTVSNGELTSTVTIADNEDSSGLPIVNVQATDATASEETLDQGLFTFTRSGGNTSATLRVFFSRGGTAAHGLDYTFDGATLVYVDFPANVLTVTQAVVPIDDALDEPAETVILTLTAQPQYTIGANSTATVTIADND